jgi:hypothetical protein
MKRSSAFVLVLLSLSAPAACAQESESFADVCAEARARFSACGASLPLLADKPCTGMTRVLSRCIASHARTCDELSSLITRVDSCVADEADGGELPPAEDLSLPLAHHADAAASKDAASVQTDAAGVRDASLSPQDAGVDAAASRDAAAATVWSGIDESGTVHSTQYARFTTPTLRAARYRFTLTGTFDADLYVNVDSAPAINRYDCRSIGTSSNEICVVTSTTSGVIHLGVRGVAPTSTFRLLGAELP